MISASVQDAIAQPNSVQNSRMRPLWRARARTHSTHAISAASGVTRSSTHSVTRPPPTRSPIQAANTPVARATRPTAPRKRGRMRTRSIKYPSTQEPGPVSTLRQTTSAPGAHDTGRPDFRCGLFGGEAAECQIAAGASLKLLRLPQLPPHACQSTLGRARPRPALDDQQSPTIALGSLLLLGIATLWVGPDLVAARRDQRQLWIHAGPI